MKQELSGLGGWLGGGVAAVVAVEQPGSRGKEGTNEQYIRNGNGKRELEPRVDAIQLAPFYTTVDWTKLRLRVNPAFLIGLGEMLDTIQRNFDRKNVCRIPANPGEIQLCICIPRRRHFGFLAGEIVCHPRTTELCPDPNTPRQSHN